MRALEELHKDLWDGFFYEKCSKFAPALNKLEKLMEKLREKEE